MFTPYRDVQEWYLPSWRVEPKYSTKVLIGNWLEERKKVCVGENNDGKGREGRRRRRRTPPKASPPNLQP